MSEAYRRNYARIRWAPLPPIPPRERTVNVAPYVISDTMPGTLHMATGQMTDSKSKFRAMTKAAGCEEVGNSAFPEQKPWEPPSARQDILRAMNRV